MEEREERNRQKDENKEYETHDWGGSKKKRKKRFDINQTVL